MRGSTVSDDNWSTESLEIGSLLLWDENSRFPDKYFEKPEQDLINFFLSRKSFKLPSFTEEIVNEIDVPQIERIVVLRDGERNIVVEGNRRLTAYKLLANPELAKGDKNFAHFEALSKRANIDSTFAVEAAVTTIKAQADRVVERKHMKSNNEIGWGDSERAHHSARKGQANRQTQTKVAIARELKKTGLSESLIDQVLGPGYVTTFQRIMSGSAAAEIFEYEIADGGELQVSDSSFLDKLRVVALNVLEKQSYDGQEINSRTLNKNEDIKEYLDGIGDKQIKSAAETIEKATGTNLLGETTITLEGKDKKKTPRTSARKYLIPGSCILQIDGANKINNIYYELQKTIILDDSKQASPNAAAVLFRVFLETSLDYYLEKQGQTVKQDDTISSKIPLVVTSMQKSNDNLPAKFFTNINTVASAKPEVSILSIVNFHQYVHSHSTQPLSNDLKTAWDKLQPFFEYLWDSLHKQYTAKSEKR
ncbi:MAG: hypothetical protein WAV04_02880 [Candidatus Microsaccharimonas sp.]